MDSKQHLSKSWIVDKVHKAVYTGGDVHYLPTVTKIDGIDIDSKNGELIASMRDGDVAIFSSIEGALIRTLQGEVM